MPFCGAELDPKMVSSDVKYCKFSFTRKLHKSSVLERHGMNYSHDSLSLFDSTVKICNIPNE